MNDSDRRERDAQRDAVAEVLDASDEVSLLRTSTGEVLVYDERDEKRRPTELRAIVMPDGSTRDVARRRFRRR